MSLPTHQTAQPGDEQTQLAAGLTGDQTQPERDQAAGSQAHALREPAPAVVVEPEPREPDTEPGEYDEPDDVEPGEEQPERLPTLVIPDLRPYADPKAAVRVAHRGLKAGRRPARSIGRRTAAGLSAAARHVTGGTATLLRLLVGWLTGTYGQTGSRAARLGILAFVGLGVARTVAEHPDTGTGALVCAWLLAAVATDRGAADALLKKRKGKQQTTEKTAPAKGTENTAGDAPARRPNRLARWLRKSAAQVPAEALEEDPAEDVDEPPLTALIRELIGDDNGVHLQVLRPALRERFPHLAQATDQQLRKVLVDAGWDPSRTFRARGVAGRAGIHRDQLPPHPSPESGAGALSTPLSAKNRPADLRKSPAAERAERGAKRGWSRRRKLPEGWTAQDVERGYRWVNDASRGPSAWTMQRLGGD
ncbi:hypothetical protein [Streptomyces sp. BSE6.1]|uniref:hypothetical protein n=1 Tax=Streptomyces sp. BSE6.1 TaxID=2605730 RepID=UPI001F266562|nr:hypothetical protein [Streptomyces sp. BSE6.1]